MVSVELHPGDVYKNGVFVASGIWSDGSDLTFVTETGSGQSGHGWIPPYTDGRPLAAITLFARISATASAAGDVPLSASVVFANPGGVGSTPFSDVEFTASVPNDGAIRTLSFPADYGVFGADIGAVTARLAGGSGTTAGLRAIRWATTPPAIVGTRSATIYETWLQLDLRALAPPPLRRFPRSDGYGVGPRRHFPPPESRRSVGGYK